MYKYFNRWTDDGTLRRSMPSFIRPKFKIAMAAGDLFQGLVATYRDSLDNWNERTRIICSCAASVACAKALNDGL
jgi:hypothetical protein